MFGFFLFFYLEALHMFYLCFFHPKLQKIYHLLCAFPSRKLKVQLPEASVLTFKICKTRDIRDYLELPLLGLLTKSKRSRNPRCNCSAVVIWDTRMLWHRGKEGQLQDGVGRLEAGVSETQHALQGSEVSCLGKEVRLPCSHSGTRALRGWSSVATFVQQSWPGGCSPCSSWSCSWDWWQCKECPCDPYLQTPCRNVLWWDFKHCSSIISVRFKNLEGYHKNSPAQASSERSFIQRVIFS